MNRPLLLAAFLVFGQLPAPAHMMSVSQSRIDLDGGWASIELRVPLYELTHVADQPALLATWTLQGASPRFVCMDEGEERVCRGSLAVNPNQPLTVATRFSDLLVANHLHFATARHDNQLARVVLHSGQARADLIFGACDIAGEIKGSLWQTFGSWGHWLLLASAAFAIRTRRERLTTPLAFALGGLAMFAPWTPYPRWIDAAAGVVVAYTACEVLFLHSAGGRAVAALALGAVQGFGLRGMPAAGAWAVSGLSLVLLALASLRSPWPRALSYLLLAGGLAWFLLQYLNMRPAG